MLRLLCSLSLLLLLACTGASEEQNEEIKLPFYRSNLLNLELLRDCNKEIFRYYEIGSKYPESSASLIKKLYSKGKVQISDNVSGYITFHFIVNCKGWMGEFIIYQLDQNFNRKKFDSSLIGSLQNFIEGLNNFKINKDKNYYYYFTFKIVNGHVIEILP